MQNYRRNSRCCKSQVVLTFICRSGPEGTNKAVPSSGGWQIDRVQKKPLEEAQLRYLQEAISDFWARDIPP